MDLDQYLEKMITNTIVIWILLNGSRISCCYRPLVLKWIEMKWTSIPTVNLVLNRVKSGNHQARIFPIKPYVLLKMMAKWIGTQFTTCFYIGKVKIAQTELFLDLNPSVPCYGMSTPTNNWAYRHLENWVRQQCTQPFVSQRLPKVNGQVVWTKLVSKCISCCVPLAGLDRPLAGPGPAAKQLVFAT